MLGKVVVLRTHTSHVGCINFTCNLSYFLQLPRCKERFIQAQRWIIYYFDTVKSSTNLFGAFLKVGPRNQVRNSLKRWRILKRRCIHVMFFGWEISALPKQQTKIKNQEVYKSCHKIVDLLIVCWWDFLRDMATVDILPAAKHGTWWEHVTCQFARVFQQVYFISSNIPVFRRNKQQSNCTIRQMLVTF